MRLVQGCIVLTLIMLAAAIACGMVGAYREYPAPWAAASIAATSCWLAGLGALLLTHWAAARFQAYGVLVGNLIRLAVPLAVGLSVDRAVGILSASHVFGMVLACYFVMLVTETFVSLRTIAPQAHGRRGVAVKSLPSG